VRERFSAAFALPADAWLEWARDEATLAAGEGEEEGVRYTDMCIYIYV
jgi:hypothetical protein